MQHSYRPMGVTSGFGGGESAFGTTRLGWILRLCVIGVACLGLWLLVLLILPPNRLLTYLAFFVPFALFVGSSCAAIFLRLRSGPLHTDLPTAVRRGGEVALVLVANLSLSASHHWGAAPLLVTLALPSAVELVYWARTPTFEDGFRPLK